MIDKCLLDNNDIKSDIKFTYILLFSLVKILKLHLPFKFTLQENEEKILNEVHEIRHRLLEMFEPLDEENKKITPFDEKEYAELEEKIRKLENDETRKMRARLKDISAFLVERYMDKEISEWYKDAFIKVICDKCTLRDTDRNNA
jgi:hypothetical protein